jgi:predicted porin
VIKKTIALSALLLSAASAQAQSNVTLYGIADAGLEYVDKTPKGGGHSSLIEMGSGQSIPNLLGFKGSEDLGGGLKTGFVLELGYLLTNGQLGLGSGTTAQSGFFGRQANVSLSSGATSITLGRQYSPAFMAFLTTEPLGGRQTVSGQIPWAFATLPIVNSAGTVVSAGNTNTNEFIDAFFSNGVTLSTNFAGVNLSALYSVGGIPGSVAAGSGISIGASYTGPFKLSAGYQSSRGMGGAGTSAVIDEKFTLGAAYTLGSLTFRGNWLNMKIKSDAQVTTVNTNLYGASVAWNYPQQNTLSLAYYDGRNSAIADDRARTLVLNEEYALSKSTTLYALVAHSSAQRQADGSVLILYDSAPNGSSNEVQIGIRHLF